METETRFTDLKLDASFLTGELALKYSKMRGKHFPFVRIGMGSSFQLQESNKQSRSIKTPAGLATRVSNDDIVSAITLHPGFRVGTEWYLKEAYIFTLGLVYTRELMLLRSISSSSNALGMYVAVNIL